ncbi:PAP2-domain-containing protein [Trametes sanguinea]|nr:PAP2-domain-containing protein [Trametes sanguinea]
MSWWLRALDQALTTLTACVLLYTRSAGVAYFVVGAVLCSITVKILKRCFRQPRPVTVIVNGRRRKKSYGMPSTHSAVIMFFATYITLACAFLPIHPSFPSSPALTRGMPPLVVVPLASTIAVSRIWLGHHTWPQVAAGCAYGLAVAPLWFVLWTKGLNEYGQKAEGLLESYMPF